MKQMQAQASLDLFDEKPAVTDQVLLIAKDGLSHFRNQMARYAKQWPYLIPEWQAWINYYERMQRYGYEAAEEIHPREPESEPALIFRAMGLKPCFDNATRSGA